MVRIMKYLILRHHFYQCLQLLSFNSAIVKKKERQHQRKRGKVEFKNSNSSDKRLIYQTQNTDINIQ